MSTLEQNYTKYTNTQRVEIYHGHYDEHSHKFTHVASVYVSDTLKGYDALSKAYMLSTHINSAWYTGSMVDAKVSHARSTQMGDVLVLNDVSYIVTRNGFEKQRSVLSNSNV